MKRIVIPKGFWLAGFVAVVFLTVNTASTESAVLKHTPNMRMTDLAGRPDTDQVEFSGGGRMSVGTIRRLEAAAQKLRTPGVYRIPAAVRTKPAATGTRLNNAADLAEALKRPDNETVQLPSGQRATVGQIKFVQPEVERQLGRKLTAIPSRPNLAGSTLKVTRNTTEDEWKNILQKPDSTVIESPHGTRITVGELKQFLRTTPANERRK